MPASFAADMPDKKGCWVAVEVVEAPAFGHLDVQLEQGWWAGRPALALPCQNGHAHSPTLRKAARPGPEDNSPPVAATGITFK